MTAPIAKPAEQPARNRENHSVALIYITPALTNSLLLASGDCEKIIVLALGAGGMLKSHEAVLDKLHNELGKKIYLKSQCMYGNIEALYEAHSGTKKFIPVNGSSIEWLCAPQNLTLYRGNNYVCTNFSREMCCIQKTRTPL